MKQSVVMAFNMKGEFGATKDNINGDYTSYFIVVEMRGARHQ